MKKINRRIISARIIPILLILFSIILLIFGKKNILGFAVAEPQAVQINYFVAIISLLIGFVTLLLSQKYSPDWRRSVARKRLEDLLAHHENKVKFEPAFNIMDRFEYVRKTNKSLNIRGREYALYEGKVKEEYGGGKEKFTVDTAKMFEMNLPDGKYTHMPSHIDIQYGGQEHRNENIPWREFLQENEDILKKYQISIDEMLKNLEHRQKE